MLFGSKRAGDTAWLLAVFPPFEVPHDDPADPFSRSLRTTAFEEIRRARPLELRRKLEERRTGRRQDPVLYQLLGVAHLYEHALDAADSLEEARRNTQTALELWESRLEDADGDAQEAYRGLLAGARVNMAFIERLRGRPDLARGHLDLAALLDATQSAVWIGWLSLASRDEDLDELVHVFARMQRLHPGWTNDAELHAALRVDTDLAFFRRTALFAHVRPAGQGAVVELSRKVAI